LTCYYPHVLSLRAYLAARLLADTKSASGHGGDGDRLLEARLSREQGTRAEVARALLDRVVVAHGEGGGRAADPRVRARDLLLFSQLEPASTLSRPACRTPDWAVLQREVGRALSSPSTRRASQFQFWFRVGRLLRRVAAVPALVGAFPPAHLLCQGFERAAVRGLSAVPVDVSHRIPGVVAVEPNLHIATLTGADWCFLLSVLGKRGCDYMLDLLLECAVFCPTELEPGNLYQLSGKKQRCW
jgi:hypothetical protein